MITLQANPGLDRQLTDDAQLILLWRNGRRRREGLLLVVGVCPFPGCTDRRVIVEGYLVGDGLREVVYDAGDLRFEHHGAQDHGARPPGRVFGVSIGLDDATVEVVDPVWSHRAVAWLEEALDAEVRAALRRRFDRARAAVDGLGGEDRQLEERLDVVLAGFQRGMAEREGAPRLGPRRAPRVGRNDPCPCGSGRKFKRCCQRVA